MKRLLIYLLVSWALVTAAVLLFTCLARGEGSTAHIMAHASTSWGPVEGFVQVPVGGSATSPHRPTVDELGIDTGSLHSLNLWGGLGKHYLYAKANLFTLKGDTFLAQDLISHGKTFRAGTPINSTIRLNWYEAGYSYRGLRSGNFTFSPSIGVTVFDFSYELTGAGNVADRNYIKTAPHVGCDIAWKLHRDLTLSVEGSTTTPFADMPWIVSISLSGKYRVYKKVYLNMGVSYRRIEYEGGNHHRIHNHTLVNAGPLFRGGIEVNF